MLRKLSRQTIYKQKGRQLGQLQGRKDIITPPFFFSSTFSWSLKVQADTECVAYVRTMPNTLNPWDGKDDAMTLE